ncbi:MAG: hypothetical protein D8M58_20925 [Calditrichaeota bacterium]|nr:MAG: hypothetical protein DWQ03_16640 [Calditrichota bacterium]MBL1207875.1 hypothetical protein [Calditrichota bacterium]
MKVMKSLLILSFLSFILVNCSESTSPTPTEGSIKISIRNGSSTFAKTTSTITITEARIVIDEIEFESSLGDSLDFEFEQPFIQDLVSGNNLHEIESVEVPFGSYKETEIEIDDLDPKDGDVYAQNPVLQDISVLVKGFVNGDSSEAFVFTSDIEAEQEKEFDQPLVLDENSPSTNIVISVDIAGWFINDQGQDLDPRISENRSIIEDNIEASFEIFEDEDDDGEDDD